jgi:peptidoglycan/xylan/chitin deacetylase (PgdA/CDA1 family)
MVTRLSQRTLLLPFLLVAGCIARRPCDALERSAPPSALAAPARLTAAPPRTAAARLRLAITIDDLPGNEVPTPAWPKSKLMGELVRILRAHRVPAPVGFVNGIYATAQPDAELALRQWIEAGFELGNHTYSHLSANELTVSAFLADVARNEALLPAKPATDGPRYFRFPYLERGGTPEKRKSLREALHEQGYRIADVSVDFADWAFTPPFARCAAAGDETALRALSTAYLENAMAALYWSHESAQKLFGRAIPHVLLLHAIVPTARNLDALLTAYETAGVELIALRDALADPAYAEEPGTDHGDTNALSEAMRRQHAPLFSFVPRSISLLELACRSGG